MLNKTKRRNKFIPINRINLNAKMYKPKANRFKQGALFGFVALCFVTPCTNWLIPLTLKGISKLNPLWVYK